MTSWGERTLFVWIGALLGALLGALSLVLAGCNDLPEAASPAAESAPAKCPHAGEVIGKYTQPHSIKINVICGDDSSTELILRKQDPAAYRNCDKGEKYPACKEG